jgi:hypothetical protein
VDYAGSQPDPKKIAIIQNFPTPHIATNVRAFLVLIGYYGRFISGYAKIAEPLFALTKKECKLFWTPICQTTFVALKRRLIEVPILVRLDFNKPFILDIDWSIKGVGVILS